MKIESNREIAKLPDRQIWRLSVLLFSVTLVLASCARAPRAVTVPRLSPFDQLRADLAQLFLTPDLAHALWGVKIESLDTNEVLYDLNGSKLVMPASNMKIVTLATAATRLGWDYRFETRLVSSAPVENGLLRGDLIVVGGGDPSINGRGGDRNRVFTAWAGELRAAGITAIEGRLVGDDDRFDDETIGSGWSWDDLVFGFAAPVGALQYNEDLVEVWFKAGPSEGDPVEIEIRPPYSGLVVVNHLATATKESALRADLRRLPGQNELEIRGSVPAGSAPFVRTAAVDNPTEFFVRALRAALIDAGIDVRGEAVDIDNLGRPAPIEESGGAGLPPAPRVLVRHLSPPLAEIAIVLMKTSQNLYAETLLKAAAPAEPLSWDGGRQRVTETLQSWGIAPTEFVLADGSGLSRYNYLTADLLVRILRQMRNEPSRAPFEATLPVGGVDGTLGGRMKATRAEGVVRAKTGTIANVRSLSGYVTTVDGETLVFSIIANHFNIAPQTVIERIDKAAERLATFSRKQ